MIDVLHTILTDASTRDASAVESQLIDATSAGGPWGDEA
jgi:hypothetical protein